MSAGSRVFLVDRHELFRQILAEWLELHTRWRVVGSRPDIPVSDLVLSGCRAELVVVEPPQPGLTGLAELRRLVAMKPRIPVLALLSRSHPAYAREVLRCGVAGMLCKCDPPQVLASAMERLAVGGRVLGRQWHEISVLWLQGGAEMDPPLRCLTRREAEVFQAVVEGLTNKEVAMRLGLKLGTIKKHRENLQRKLGCHHPGELTRFAAEWGLL